MKLTSLLTLGLVLGVITTTGCRRRSSPPAPPAPEAPAAPAQPQQPAAAAAAAPPPPPQPVAQPGNAPSSQFNYVEGSSALDDLNKHLSWFVISKKRFPANVDELLAANRLPRPVLPPGGQLIINQKTKTVDYVGPK